MVDTETSISKIIYKNSEIDTGTVIPIYPEREYKRPSDWLVIPEMDGTKDEIYILNGVGEYCLNQVAFELTGVGTIDWGDGTTEEFSNINNVTFSHIYNHETISNNTWTEYSETKQVLIHIYADRGAITRFNTNISYTFIRPNGTNGTYSSEVATNIYEIKANVEYCTLIAGGNSSRIKHNFLEVFDWQGELSNTNLDYTFAYTMSNLRTIPHLNAKNATSMKNTFSNCGKLINVNLKDCDTSNVTSMYWLFYNCESLTSLDLSSFDTSSVTNMQSMFYNCKSLTSLDLSSFNTSNVTSMSGMFYDCESLTTIKGLTNFNTSNVTSMSGMFFGLRNIKKLDLSNFDTSNVTTMGDMFMYCESLEEIKMNVKNITTLSRAFHGCETLKNIKLNTKNATSLYSLFFMCENLRTVELNTSKNTSFNDIFYFCRTIKNIKLDMSMLTSINSGALYNCLNLQKLELYNLNPNFTEAITIGISASQLLTAQALVDLFNSLAVNINSYSRTIQLGTILRNYLTDVYVKDSGQLYTIILPTSDTEVGQNKTYYTYDEETDTYTEVVPDFTSDTIYYELKTATWNRYDICESTDEGAMLALDFATNVKGYTIT